MMRFSSCSLRAAVSLLALFAAHTAHAQVLVYDNGAPNLADGQNMSQYIQAEDFSLASATVLSGVRFWTTEAAGAYRNSLTWWIYANNGGTPGSVIATGTTGALTRTGTGRTNELDEFVNDFSLPSVSLDAGSYWLGLHNGFPSEVSATDMYWETTNINSTAAGREDFEPFGDSFVTNGNEHAFQLSGVSAVPEPGPLALAASGLLPLAGIMLRRRRQRKHQ